MQVLSANVDPSADVAAGDDRAFDHLFRSHYPRVYQILSGLLGPDEADDTAQETFLRLYHSPMRQAEPERIGAWLYRVAVNLAYNSLRSRRRQSAHLQRAGTLAQADTNQQQTELNPAQAVAAREEAALVRAALAELSETHRLVLVLRQAGLSYAEVAVAASIKPSSVGTLLARAEAHLRQHYLRLAASPDRPHSATGELP